MSKSFDERTHVMERALCPICGYAPDRATRAMGKGNRPPQKDDISVCFGCGAVLQFNADLTLRSMNFMEFSKLTPYQRRLIGEAQRWIKEHPITRRETKH